MSRVAAYQGGGSESDTNTLLSGFEALHSGAKFPLRIAGGIGFVLLVTIGSIGVWIRENRKNGPAMCGTVLVFLSLSLLAIGQVIASRNAATVMWPRTFTAADLEQDRRERTMVNPPGHLNPNPSRPGRLASITFGSDRAEQVPVVELDKSAAEYVDVFRVVGFVAGGTGIVCLVLSRLRSPNRAPNRDAMSNANDSNTKDW